MKLLEFQQQPAQYLVDVHAHKRVSVDLSDAGIGKTYMAAHLALQLGVPTLVVCKKISIPDWEEVFTMAGVDDFYVVNYEHLNRNKSQRFVKKTPATKRSRSKFKWGIPKDSLIIFDEAQALTGQSSSVASLLIDAKRQGLRIHLASATLAETPFKLFAVGFALGLHHLHNFQSFLAANGCVETDYGKVYEASSGAMERIGRKITPDFGIRLRKEDLPCFPSRRIELELITMWDRDAVKKLYHAMRKEVEELHLLKVDDVNPENTLTCILRERQEAELLKVPFLVGSIERDLRLGFSVCVFVNFTKTVAAISERLKVPHIKITGGQKQDERNQAIKDFQANKIHVSLANIAAGGVSISLHDLHGRKRRSYISPSFSAIQVIQATDRIHRANGVSDAHISYVFLAGTAEEGVHNAVKSKTRRISELNDGDLQSPYLAIPPDTIKIEPKPDVEKPTEAGADILNRLMI